MALSATFIFFLPATNRDRPAANQDRPVTNRDRPNTNQDRPNTNRDRPATNRDRPAANRDRPATNRDRPATNRDHLGPRNKVIAMSKEDISKEKKINKVVRPFNNNTIIPFYFNGVKLNVISYFLALSLGFILMPTRIGTWSSSPPSPISYLI